MGRFVSLRSLRRIVAEARKGGKGPSLSYLDGLQGSATACPRRVSGRSQSSRHQRANCLPLLRAEVLAASPASFALLAGADNNGVCSPENWPNADRKSTRLNSSHLGIS